MARATGDGRAMSARVVFAFLAPLAAAPEAEFLLTGVEDPEANIHAPNESVHLGELRRALEAEIRFLSYLGAEDADRARTPRAGRA